MGFTPGPPDGSNNFLSEQISKQQKNNFHSTSLTSGPVKMVANSVNKTALHPGGVAPQNEHTSTTTVCQLLLTHPCRPCTKMPLSTRLALQLLPRVPSLHTLVRRLDVPHPTSVL